MPGPLLALDRHRAVSTSDQPKCSHSYRLGSVVQCDVRRKLKAKFKLSVDARRMVGQNDSFTLTAEVVLNHRLEIWALGKPPREDNNLEAISTKQLP